MGEDVHCQRRHVVDAAVGLGGVQAAAADAIPRCGDAVDFPRLGCILPWEEAAAGTAAAGAGLGLSRAQWDTGKSRHAVHVVIGLFGLDVGHV